MGIQVKEYKEKKVIDYFKKSEYKKIGFFFWHGLGDLIMFLPVWQYLNSVHGMTHNYLILQKGIGQEKIYPEALFVKNEKELESFNLDIIFHIHFPLSEFDKTVIPKVEKCCIEELGISPISYFMRPDFINYDHVFHLEYDGDKSKLIGVSFQVTAMPDSGNVDYDTAKQIWNEIKTVGYTPIEIMMEHKYHNGKNKKYDFIGDATLRGCGANLGIMNSIISNCFAFIGTSSGPFHLATMRLPVYRLGYFERDMPLISITREKLKVFNVKNYQEGSVKKWVDMLS